MRIALALALLAHGLAHLVGFLTPWSMVPRQRSTAPVPNSTVILGGRVRLGSVASRGLSVVWLSLAAGFVAVARGFWQQSAWSLGAVIAVCMVSLVVTLMWWPTARIGVAINLALLAGLLAVGLAEFRRDMRLARDRVSRSSIVQTAAGPIEYATSGSGQPVLALHGTAGGWDQGLNAASGITPYGYRVIAPSRFGYLRTPWRGDASPVLEADTWAMLLDSLGIDRVAVMSWSAGAAPAMQFALRHPERVSKLVFFVPGAGGIMPSQPGPPLRVVDLTFKWDFPIWAAQRVNARMRRARTRDTGDDPRGETQFSPRRRTLSSHRCTCVRDVDFQ
jgi:hypothetical protein